MDYILMLHTVFVLVSIYLVARSIYRLLFHPLAGLPGPKLAALTDYWELYQDFCRGEGGYLYFELDRLHEKYGPVVRIRPNEVHINDPEWLELLYSGPSDPRDRDSLIAGGIGVPTARPYELHRIRKAAISPFFSTRAVAEMESSIRSSTIDLLANLETHSGGILDMRTYFLAWTTDFITGFIFRNSTRLFWSPNEASSWYQLVRDFAAMFPLVKHFPWLVTTALELPLITWKIFIPQLVPFVKQYKDLLRLAIVSHDRYQAKPVILSEEQLQTSRDIFEVMLASDLPPQEKRPKRMANEVYNLLIAGSFTASKILVITTFYILADPELYKCLQSELTEHITDRQNMPSVKELQKLPILESLRIANILTTRNPMIARNKDLTFGDIVVPAGTSISMTACKAAMDPRIFPSPKSFRPSRWRDGTQRPFDYERYVLAFGRGSRSCVGRHLALAQLFLVLASVFRWVDMELFHTTRERDIEIRGGGPLGEPTHSSKGMRIHVRGTRS